MNWFKTTLDIHSDLTQLIGNTPLVKIPSLSHQTQCNILAKVEYMNPSGSCKDRIALSIILQAQLEGRISPGDTLFEGSVGSTAIALATVSKALGYKCTIVLPDDQALEKYHLLEALGANLIKTRPCSIIHPKHYVNIAKQKCLEFNQSELLKPIEERTRGYFCDQFENLDNYFAHLTTTGPEIYKQTAGTIDALVLGAGTGGTIAGCGHYLKKSKKSTLVVLADPQGSGLFNKVKYNIMYSPLEAEGTRKQHQVDTVVEGIGNNRLVENFKKALPVIDDAIQVSDSEAVFMSRYLMDHDGFFVGSSSAVNCVAAVRLAKKLGPGHTIVTMFCDHGSRHLTKFWNRDLIESLGLMNPSLLEDSLKFLTRKKDD